MPLDGIASERLYWTELGDREDVMMSQTKKILAAKMGVTLLETTNLATQDRGYTVLREDQPGGESFYSLSEAQACFDEAVKSLTH